MRYNTSIHSFEKSLLNERPDKRGTIKPTISFFSLHPSLHLSFLLPDGLVSLDTKFHLGTIFPR